MTRNSFSIWAKFLSVASRVCEVKDTGWFSCKSTPLVVFSDASTWSVTGEDGS